jgi:hypothetical protein
MRYPLHLHHCAHQTALHSLGCNTGRVLNDELLGLGAFLDAEGHLTIPPLRVHAHSSRRARGWHTNPWHVQKQEDFDCPNESV